MGAEKKKWINIYSELMGLESSRSPSRNVSVCVWESGCVRRTVGRYTVCMYSAGLVCASSSLVHLRARNNFRTGQREETEREGEGDRDIKRRRWERDGEVVDGHDERVQEGSSKKKPSGERR